MGSCRYSGLGIPAIVGDDEHAIGLAGHLLFGGLMELAVNHVDESWKNPK